MSTDAGSHQPRVWLLRSGRNGERDGFALKQGYAGGGFQRSPISRLLATSMPATTSSSR